MRYKKDQRKRYIAEAEAAFQRYFAKDNAFTPAARAELDIRAKSLLTAYLIERLETGAEQLMLIQRARQPIPAPLLVELWHLLAMARMLDVPAVNVLVLLVDFYLAPSVRKYEAFKSALTKNLPQMGVLAYPLFKQLLNTLYFIPFEGDITVEYFSLHKFGMDNDLMTEDGGISFERFVNVALFAYLLEEKEFLVKFSKKYGPMLKGNKRITDNSKDLVQCYILFLKGKYKEVLELLPNIKNIIPEFTLIKQMLEFKAIYMAYKNKYDAFDLLDNKKNKFWSLTRRRKNAGLISELQHTRLNNFFNFLCKAAKLNKNKVKKAALLKDLEKNKDKVAEYRWLKKIIEQL